MSEEITKELREFVYRCSAPSSTKRRLATIADRMDAESDRRCRAAYDDGYANADDWCAEQDEDTLKDHGLMRLPTDKDGEPWRIGDACDVAGKKNHVLFVSHKSVMVAKSMDMWNRAVSFPADELGHWKPTPAERIRECAQDLARGKCRRPDPRLGEDAVLDIVASRLATIAGELEGGSE